MTVYLSKHGGRVLLRARAESPGIVGDFVQEVRPGDVVFGRTYAEWLATAEGPVEVETA